MRYRDSRLDLLVVTVGAVLIALGVVFSSRLVAVGVLSMLTGLLLTIKRRRDLARRQDPGFQDARRRRLSATTQPRSRKAGSRRRTRR